MAVRRSYIARMSADLNNESLVQLRLGHLGMIQNVVGRLAGYSAAVKNFCITVTTGGIVATFASNAAGLLWISLTAVLLFATLDAYYLALERAFRAFYGEVAERPLSEAGDLAIKRRKLSWWTALGSPSVWPFYLPQLIVVVMLIVYK